MRTRRPLSRGVPAPLDGDALTNGARWLAVAGVATGGDRMNLTAIEAAIRALAQARAARKAFEAQHGLLAHRRYFLDGPVYAEHDRLIVDYHEAGAALWRAVNQAVEEVTE